MAKDKREEKLKLVVDLIEIYVNKKNKKKWNENDTFDVACWFLGVIIVMIWEAHIIPEDVLHERIKKKLNEFVDDVFEELSKVLEKN